jgi:signal transduction histidine kinase
MRLALEDPPDLIICDVMMPKLDGYQVLRALRQNPRTALIPFIFLTAKADRTDLRAGMELGADDYLSKPFSSEELLESINARLERRTVASEARSRKLEEVKLSLAQLVANELRTPLVSMRMVQDIIARQVGLLQPAQMQEFFEALGSGSRRLTHLVEQMVYLTQLEVGALSREGINEQGRAVPTGQVLTGAVDLGRRFAQSQASSPINLQIHDPDAVILADVHALKHALAELIANALDVSPDGSEVTVEEWQADSSVWIGIADQGPGISPEQLERVFGEFRAINEVLPDQRGAGLGLPLARRIIEAHSGTLTLNSVIDQGTQAALSLPVWGGA